MTTTLHRIRPLYWILLVAALAGVGVVAVWVRTGTNAALRADNERLREENLALQRGLSRVNDAAPSRGPKTETVAPLAQVGTPGASPLKQPEELAAEPAVASDAKGTDDLVLTPTGPAPAPRGAGLVLAGTHAVPIEGGMRATMRFNAQVAEPLGIVAVVVRLPRDSESRILDFAPANSSSFTGIVKRISGDGKFAVFQGTAAAMQSLELALSVSGAATADVRGTCGVGPYEIKIGPGGTSVRNL